MKNPMIYLVIVFALVVSSCAKDDAKADVETLITNLEYFNNTFDEFNEDGKISQKADGDEDSEYDKLRAIANTYYESVNKINTRIEKENEKAAKGKKIDNYEEKYHEAVKEKQEKIDKLTKEFVNNLEKIEEYK